MDYKETNSVRFSGSLPEIQLKGDQWDRNLYKRVMVHLSNGCQLNIRWMHYNDIAEVCRLERQIFSSPWPVESFLYELENRNYNISIVGLIESKLVSYAVSYLVADEIHIGNIAVATDFRRLKIGDILLQTTLQIGRANKCRVAHLEVRKSNMAAIGLYKKYDFQIVGVRKNYYENEKEDALLMTRELEMEYDDGLV